MKASFKFIIAALAATAALAGCTKEITPPNFENDKVNPAAEGSRVIAVSFAPQTKTTLEGLQPKFVNEKDTILLYTVPEDENEPLLTDTCVVKVDGSGKATIYTDLTGKLRALYPAKAAVLEDNVITAEILAVQTGKFADANIAGADIDENNSAQFENVTPLLIITPPSGTKKLIVRSLWTIGEDGQRSRRAFSINTSAEKKEQCTVTVLNPDDDGKYYVALYCDNDVKLSDLSFEAWSDNDGTTGSVKGIPTSKIAAQATALGKEYDAYNEVQYGTAYTIDDKNWHEYVEVGGHKWATMNVGADAPEEFGDYFMWGEVYGHKYVSATWTNFPDNKPADSRYPDTWTSGAGFANCNAPYYDGSDYSDSKYSTTGKIVLDLADDAANANWGGAWRMPTKEEFDALLIETSSWDDTNAGYSFGESSNKIFLPTVGYGAGVGPEKDGDGGNYWSSSLDTNRPDFAWYLYFDVNGAGTASSGRCYGQPIRAIIDEPEKEIHQDDDNEKYKHENPEWFGEE